MPNIPSSKPRKTINLDPALTRAIRRAQLEAEERGEPTSTLSQMIERAVTEYLEKHCPEALIAGKGRPRKAPRKLT